MPIAWFSRWRASRRPFPPEWRKILEHEVPFYRRLDAAARTRLEDKLKVFAWTKRFEGVQGQQIDDTVRVVISAAAARLVMNLPGEHYQRLFSIIVYPSHYRHPEQTDIVLGEANRLGSIVLSYEAVREGMRDPEDGRNTAFHEFAHVLDTAGGAFDGTPMLRTMGAYAPWVEVMSRHFLELREDPETRRLLRSYAGENEAEFFAVATEVFFEQPGQLRARCPDLYEVLSSYYRCDPGVDDDRRP